MSKNITTQAENKVNISGTLLNVDFGEGKTGAGAPYKRATVTVRVKQTYGGKEEISDIPVSMFATEFTAKGGKNPAWDSILKLQEMKTAQNVGIDAASHVIISGTSLQENVFVSRTGQLITGWQIRGSFINEKKAADVATFTTEIFIFGMKDEEDRDGNTTGRLIIRGGVVQYNGKLDIVDFIAESPDTVEYITRNWETEGTVTVRGRVRVASREEEVAPSGWGEDVPETTTRLVRELIITTGDDACKEEEFAYNVDEIKKAYNERKAMIEQIQINARKTAPKQGAGSANSAEADSKKYSWE